MFSNFKTPTQNITAYIPAVFQFNICAGIHSERARKETTRQQEIWAVTYLPECITPSFLHTLQHNLYLIAYLLKSLRKGVIISYIKQ